VRILSKIPGCATLLAATASVAFAQSQPRQLKPRWLNGPYESIEAFCAQFQQDKIGKKLSYVPWPFDDRCFLANEDEPNKCPSDLSDEQASGDWNALAKPLPFLAVRWFPSHHHEQAVGNLAIKTDEGWFLSTYSLVGYSVVVPQTPIVVSGKSPGQTTLLAEFIVKRATATGPDCEGRGYQSAARFVLVCGIGASKKPSCTPPIPVGYDPWLSYEQGVTKNLARLEVSPEARLTILAADNALGQKLPPSVRSLFGTQLLTFP
jgi:hypothetical protein